MKKLLIICLFFVIGSLSQSAFSQTPQPTATPADEAEVVKISTTLIRADVIVTDEKNRPVKNLRSEDFEVFENGKKQEIFSFSYISPTSPGRSNMSGADNLGLQNDEDGLSLKEKINIPTTTKEIDSNTIRRTLVLVVDDIGLSFKSVGLVKKSLKKFIKDQIRDGDLVSVVTTGGASVLPAFTSDKKQLLAIVEKLKWGPRSRGGADYYDPIAPTLLEETSDARGRDIAGVREETALLEDMELARKNNSAVGTIGALQYIVQGMRNLPGRKALVLFSEGFSLSDSTLRNSSNSDIDTSSEAPKPSANNRFGSEAPDALRSLIETANKASVAIYPIDPRGLQYLGMAGADEDIRKAFDRNFKPGQTDDKRTSRDSQFRQSQDGLRVLASDTGGFAVLNQNDLDVGLEKIIDDQNYYLLSFQTSAETVDSPKDVFENVEIKLKNPDLKVRYRSAFYSPESVESNNSSLSPREKVGQALAYPFRANEIDLHLYSITGNYEYGDFVRFLINISAGDLEFKKQPDGMRKANFDILALTLNEDGKPINQFAKNFSFSVNEPTYKNILKKGFVYVLPVVLKKSGVYHFRVAVHDSETGKVGAAAQFLETPKFEKKRLWVSNLTLRSVSNDGTGTVDAENDKKMFTDTTLRHFSPPADLLYGAVIYNAETRGDLSPDLAIRTRLIKDDKVISETPFEPISIKEQKDLKRIDLAGNIKLKENLSPGNYIIQIIVMDKLAKEKSQIATQWVDFEIVGR
ncbi:MAG: VWA domain-containing protein [Pyrinomonadaceae bacterium]